MATSQNRSRIQAFYSYINFLVILDKKLDLPHALLPPLWLSFLYLLYYILWHKRLLKTHLAPSTLSWVSVSSTDKMFSPPHRRNTLAFPFPTLAFYDPFEMYCGARCEKYGCRLIHIQAGVLPFR